jgi:OOP family OmpA-OmpF porin
LGVIPFPHGYKAPAFERRELLDTVFGWLVADDERRVLLRGHADAGGTDGYNLRLSAARARWVRDWLVGKGIGRKRVTVQAMGEYLPLVDAEPGSASHRRVEVFGLRGACPREPVK